MYNLFKNLLQSVFCLVFIMLFVVLMGCLKAAAPKVIDEMPDAYLGGYEEFIVFIPTCDLFSDDGNNNLRLDVKQDDGAELPEWIKKKPLSMCPDFYKTLDFDNRRKLITSADMVVKDKLAYVVNDVEGLQIVNVDPSQTLDFLDTFSVKGCCSSVTVSGDYAYVSSNDCDFIGFHIIDVSDPHNPNLISSFETTDVSGINVSGKYVYLADNTTGLKIIDISDPTNSNLISSFETPNVIGIQASGNYVYLTDTTDGLKIINIDDHINPYLVSSLIVPDAGEIKIDGNYAYVLAERSNLKIIDVSNPKNPKIVGAFDELNYNVTKMFIAGNYGYLMYDNKDEGASDLCVLDITDPERLDVIMQNHYSCCNRGIFVAGDYLYTTDIFNRFFVAKDVCGGLYLQIFPGEADVDNVVVKVVASNDDGSAEMAFNINLEPFILWWLKGTEKLLFNSKIIGFVGVPVLLGATGVVCSCPVCCVGGTLGVIAIIKKIKRQN